MVVDEQEEDARIIRILYRLHEEEHRYRLQKLPEDVADFTFVDYAVRQLFDALFIKPNVADDEEKVWSFFNIILFHSFYSFYDLLTNKLFQFDINLLPIEELEVVFECRLNLAHDDTKNAFFNVYQFLEQHDVEMFKEIFANSLAFCRFRDEIPKALPKLPTLEKYQVCDRVPLSESQHEVVDSWRSGLISVVDSWKASNGENFDLLLQSWKFEKPRQKTPENPIVSKSSNSVFAEASQSPSTSNHMLVNGSTDFACSGGDNDPANSSKKNVRFAESPQSITNLPEESPTILLMAEIQKFVNEYQAKIGFDFFMTATELNEMILENIEKKSNNDTSLFNDLLNLLGEDQLEFIQKVVNEFAPKVLKERNESMSGAWNKSNNRNTNGGPKNLNATEQVWNIVQNKKNGNKFQTIKVQTQKEKRLQKDLAKIGKKMARDAKKWQSLGDFDDGSQQLTNEDLERMRIENMHKSIQAAMEPRFGKPLPQASPECEKYPFVFDLLQDIRTSTAYIAENKLLLPEGFRRLNHKFYEEYVIPILSSSEDTQEFLKKFQRILIQNCDEFIKTGFAGFESLNLIQSTVFPTAYMQDNQNMLICAPTGAGKTNIAMLTILNILKAHSVDGSLAGVQQDKFKIIYIAPMKALCAEMADTFGKRLQPFGLKVRELTGDMQLTSKEILETQMLVVTPEKWDVVTRKSVGDVQLLDLVRLIILDEVHLLQSDRGHVIETIVARTIRYVESSQKCIRLVGLSATLPNYVDVALFLRVDLYKGLYAFDERFRPVPLKKSFIGCRAGNRLQLNKDMDEITFKKVRDYLLAESQVMVFVHSRNATLNLASFLLDRGKTPQQGETNCAALFQADMNRMNGAEKFINRARFRNLNRLLESGIGIHHAGMPRPERNIVEKLFHAGVIKVLVSTSTLAWGVNLPAHAVIIRGTEFYDPAQGTMVDIDMLDVMQIFGRAGRPQFDTDGEATIITTHSKLAHYLSMLTNQLPIESKFLKRLTDNLNAEIVLGTVSNVQEAVEWLRYSYAYIRMQQNPVVYGLEMMSKMNLSIIYDHLLALIRQSAEVLDRAEMIRYNTDFENTLDATHLGRIASHFYIQHETIVHFNESMRSTMDAGAILQMFSKAKEFQQLEFREEEGDDLKKLKVDPECCPFGAQGELSNTHTKVFVLMQAAISDSNTNVHTLSSDLMYIRQNVSRLSRGLFEYVLKRGWPLLAQRLLNVSLMFEKKMWDFKTPLKQFESEIPADIMRKLETLHDNQAITFDMIREMPQGEIADVLRNKRIGNQIQKLARNVPGVILEVEIKPITRTILTVYVDVYPDFDWDDKWHGKTAQIYWLWLTDLKNNHIYHSELARFTKKQVLKSEVQRYIMTIPLLDASQLEDQYILHCSFEYWFGASFDISLSCGTLMLPDKHLPETKLLDLIPLPVRALNSSLYESIYRFKHFNPIQTQIFHTLYNTDENVLLGAPTGSGKTVAAELAIFRVFNTQLSAKVVYIAPLKALVRERVDDWKQKIQYNMGKSVVELTGDTTPDIRTIHESDLIVTTPEKWDGVSRGWPNRSYVRKVALIIIDEIHLLGEDRGPVLEMIVSRANFISRRTGQNIRLVGLSTAVANAQDLAVWLNIRKVGLYNFSASVRPVPIEVHVVGFPGKHYCPRMATMNKPAWKAIKKYSPEKPVIIFVASRRQTRITAMDLISLIAADSGGVVSTMRMVQSELDAVLETVLDSNLKHTLSFGIGIHHAGLKESDRKIVENLFALQQIQILVTTATLAWGINLPAHAVIIKGTEFFDGKKGRYIDFPITDVLQMIGRAGRPQFDTSAVAVLYVHDIKKEYYKKFLYEPFPVESHLLDVFPEHLNAEIMSKSVQTKHEAMEYLSSTYLYHRILKNPNYYGVDFRVHPENENSKEVYTSEGEINQLVLKFLSKFIDDCVDILVDDYCITFDDSDTDQRLLSTPLGKIAAYYYLSHRTVRMFQDGFGALPNEPPPYLTLVDVLSLLTNSPEYFPLPVRHNEEKTNEELSHKCPIKLDRSSMESPHTKANLLIQAHCSRISLPIVDYYTDLKTVLDQAIRILQAMIDISSLNGCLPTTLNVISLQQSIIQASWPDANQLTLLVDSDTNAPKIDNDMNDSNEYYKCFERRDFSMDQISAIPDDVASIPFLMNHAFYGSKEALRTVLQQYRLQDRLVDRIYNSLTKMPLIVLESLQITEVDCEQTFTVDKETIFKKSQDVQWLSLKTNQEYSLRINLRRQWSGGQKRTESKAFAPKFPKTKSEGWYLVLGNQVNSELIAFSRVGYIGPKMSFSLQFKSSPKPEQAMLTFYLLSDSYLGLDQQYQLPIHAK